MSTFFCVLHVHYILMAKWIHISVAVTVLTSCFLLTEGQLLQQVAPAQEQDQCEFSGFEEYEEEYGSKTILRPACTPGQYRNYSTTQIPDDFHNTEISCVNCPRGFFQKFYNKCRTCHQCTVCGEGETEEKACTSEEDAKCAVVSTTESLQPSGTPFDETPASPRETAPPLKPTDETTLEMTANQTAPAFKPALELCKDDPHATCSTTNWFYVALAFDVLFAFLFVVALICCCRERLKRKELQAVIRDNFPLNLVDDNGNVPHDNEEGDPLLGAKQPGEGAEPDILVHGDARHAMGPLAVDGIQRTKGPSDVAVDLGVRGRCAGSSEGAPCAGDDGTAGGASGTTTNEGDDGWNNHAHGSTADVEEQGAVMIRDGACDTRSTRRTINHKLDPATSSDASEDDAGCSGDPTDGEEDDVLSPSQVVDIPDDDSYIPGSSPAESATTPSEDDKADSKEGKKPGGTLVDGSYGSTGLPSDDRTKSEDTPDAKATSASGDCLTDDTSSDGVAASSEVDKDIIPNESTLSSNNGDMEGQGSVHAPPNAAPEEGATNAGIDCSGTNDTDGANHGAETPGGGQDVESSGDVQDHKKCVACGQPSDHPGVDAGEPNNAPEPAKPEIQADEVVDDKFLQHVALKVSHIKIKEICRMRGLRQSDIENIEALDCKDEQRYKFLERLLGQVGKELTYRCLLETLIESKNKHSADELIEEFNIVMK